MTTMVTMIRDGKQVGEPTGIDDALAREWEAKGKCIIIRETKASAKSKVR